MAGYTRQSIFADGDVVTAAIFNNEYNQLVAAFNSSTGHTHDGTAGEGAKISLADSVDGILGHEQGGTGYSSVLENQLLMGNVVGGFDPVYLAGGSNISISRVGSNVTISATMTGDVFSTSGDYPNLRARATTAEDVDAHPNTWVPTWTQVTGKPTTFPPSTHSHTYTDLPITSTQVSNWETAFGWGNHASAGYQPALVSTVNIKTINGNSLLGSGNIFIEGGGEGGGFTPTDLLTDYGFTDNSTNWNSAFSWGNHASAGYQDELVSTVNIKSINGASLLGSGNITISGGSGDAVLRVGDTMTGDLVMEDSATHYRDDTGLEGFNVKYNSTTQLLEFSFVGA